MNKNENQNKYVDLPQDELDKLLYDPGIIKTPFIKKTKLTYADYIASGKPAPYIEEYIIKKIYPFYSNTHSNSYNGIHMKKLIAETKDYIRQEMNLTSDYQILFTGNGTTGAINHLINCLDIDIYSDIFIFISLYEHYSNHLPWKELSNSHSNIKLILIPFVNTDTNSAQIDIKWLNNAIQQIYLDVNNVTKSKLVICSISACSNINGIINPLNKIRLILDSYPNNSKFYKYLFADYACSAPYVKIDGSILDAFFFSPHKFIGGTSTPGILIGRKCIFSRLIPYCMGGGCVRNASSKQIEYETDIEKKESAGTPNIIGIIKIGKILQLKNKYMQVINSNEHILSKLIKEKILYYELTYPTFQSILYADNVEHLPILSFNLSNLHYNYIVVLFNDLFGIQTRGGIGCCGLLAEYIESKYNFRGWCRISFHWLMSYHTINNIFDALEYIIKNGHKLLKNYEYDKTQNLYKFMNKIIK
jgi:selenocysteine lyase/cysteine desulfurase